LYSTRRYGRQVPLIQEGWNVLYHTIYNCTDGAYVSRWLFTYNLLLAISSSPAI